MGRERRGNPSQANGGHTSNHYYDDASMLIPGHSITISGIIRGKRQYLYPGDEAAPRYTGVRQAIQPITAGSSM